MTDTNRTPKSFRAVVNLWDSAEQLADEVGEKGVTVRQWRNRGSIPPVYWRRIADLARAKANGVTVEHLAQLAEQVRASA